MLEEHLPLQEEVLLPERVPLERRRALEEEQLGVQGAALGFSESARSDTDPVQAESVQQQSARAVTNCIR